MGVYLSTPKTEKLSEDGENDRIRYGLSSMQGWRATMEDAVTIFKRGGFIIGTTLNHCMMDGELINMFMNSWAEIAGGLPLSVTPFLDRSVINAKEVPQMAFPYLLLSKIEGLTIERNITQTTSTLQEEERVHTPVHFGSKKLTELKKQVIEHGVESLPTNFEVVTAFL